MPLKMTLCGIFMAALFLFTAVVFKPYKLSSSPENECSIYTDIDLYGREDEISKLSEEIQHGKNLVIEVIGIAGVGKTAVVHYTTNILVSEQGFCRICVDVSKYNATSSLINYLIQIPSCMPSYSFLYLTLASFYHRLTSFLSVDHLDHDQRMLLVWFDKLQPNTIITFDHTDSALDGIERGLLGLLPATESVKKVILISHFSKVTTLERVVIPIYGLNRTSCARWINNKYEGISLEQSERLCHELGGVPSEVKSITNYVMHPLTSGSIDEVLLKLGNEEYGKAFAYIESILGRHYIDTKEQNRAMYLLYKELQYEHRLCIWLLVEMRKSNEFTKEMATNHLPKHINVDACLNSLLTHSFLESMQPPQKVYYKFLPYIKKFIQNIGEPQEDLAFVRSNARAFYGNYVFNNAKSLHFTLESTRDFNLAVNIGNNGKLVNSLLPLVGDKYDLEPLFKISLDIIEDVFCTPASVWNNSNSKILTAFNYLTKAVHCPSIHSTALLSPPKPKLVPKPDLCLVKLQNCPAVLSMMEGNDYETAKALGYHNLLQLHAHDIAPWRFFLTDLSMIVTEANHECIIYCKVISYCGCGKLSHFEYGLREFLLKNYQRSTTYFRSALHQLSKSVSPCQTILKTLAIIGIHASNSDSSTIKYLDNIDYGTFNFSCFLGVMNDLIAPILNNVSHKESRRIYEYVNLTVEEEQQRCDQEAKTDEEMLDCSPTVRYTVAHGLVALRMKELQIESTWPKEVTNYASREEWVCSIIRDKTKKCKEALPLFSEVRAIETNKNYKFLKYIRYFMDEEEYSKLKERAMTIPMFFQLMSI